MPKYPVKSPLKHDGNDYAEGDTVEMKAAAAKELIAIGVLDSEASGGPLAPQPDKLKAEEAIAQIQAAATPEDVDAILGGDQRVTVVAAADARKAELAG